jgi:hypothetical protein
MTAQEAYEATAVGASRMMVCKGGSQVAYEEFAAQVRELELMGSRELLRITQRWHESMSAYRHIDRVQFERLE